jgi:hypothetical protein
VRYDVLTPVSNNILVFWDVMSGYLVDSYQFLEEPVASFFGIMPSNLLIVK